MATEYKLSYTATDINRRLEKVDMLVQTINSQTPDENGNIDGLATEEYVNTSAIKTLLAIYPVGAIYLSANNISPASLFGGTWEQIQDRFLLGAGSAYTAGSTGGESTHTLTVQEMPAHSHTVNAHSHAIGLDNDTTIGTYGWSLHVSANGNSVTGAQKTVTSGTSSPNTNAIGGGVAHNNMPPYLAVYMWKRIA